MKLRTLCLSRTRWLHVRERDLIDVISLAHHPTVRFELREMPAIVIPTQYAVPVKAVRSAEIAAYTGLKETSPNLEEMNDLTEEKGIMTYLEEIILKNGLATSDVVS